MVSSSMEQNFQTTIMMMGLGGAGGNVINSMINSGLTGVEFLVANTDAQDLNKSLAINKIRLGDSLTNGKGVGGNAERGRLAAEESEEKIREHLEGVDMLIICAGMGGGTGTGAAPVVARIAKEKEILTLAIISLPFAHEGLYRKETAHKGIQELERSVDTLIVFPNDKITTLYENIFFLEALKKANDIATDAAQEISEILLEAGVFNIDFEDICVTCKEAGYGLIGSGIAEGENRAVNAAKLAMGNPLLSDIDLSGCKGLLVSITCGEECVLSEYTTINTIITNATGHKIKFKTGFYLNPKMGNKIKVTIIAAGLSSSDAVKALSMDTKPNQENERGSTPPVPTEPIIIKTPDLSEIMTRIKNANSNEVIQGQIPNIVATDFKQTEPPAFLRNAYN